MTSLKKAATGGAAVLALLASAYHGASGSSEPLSKAAQASVAMPKEAPPAVPDIHLSGTGQQVTQHFTVTDGIAVFRSTCSACTAVFSVELLDSTGRTKDLLVAGIGGYDGSKGEGLSAGDYILKVDADTAWTITISQPRNQPAASLPQTYKGKGDSLVGPFEAANAVALKGTNAGEGVFAVEILDVHGAVQDLPFASIGSFSGSTVSQMFNGGPYFLNVSSDGTWTLDLSKP
jgi:hypothetical protein